MSSERRLEQLEQQLQHLTTHSCEITDDASILSLPMFARMGYLTGTRSQRDPSYQRPLQLDPAANRWNS
jgi:hypothetical protein